MLPKSYLDNRRCEIGTVSTQHIDRSLEFLIDLITPRVHKHDTVRKLTFAVETVDFVAILENGSKRDDIVKIES